MSTWCGCEVINQCWSENPPSGYNKNTKWILQTILPIQKKVHSPKYFSETWSNTTWSHCSTQTLGSVKYQNTVLISKTLIFFICWNKVMWFGNPLAHVLSQQSSIVLHNIQLHVGRNTPGTVDLQPKSYRVPRLRASSGWDKHVTFKYIDDSNGNGRRAPCMQVCLAKNKILYVKKTCIVWS